jgi:nickel/cobalt transporter (NiCoT) family protein
MKAVRGLDAAQHRSLVAMAAVVLGLHALGFLLLSSLHHRALLLGTGLTAYTLGLRHAFDADHICAIDNTTRKLMAEGKRPLSVGFWFSLGHSSVVFTLSFLVALGVRAAGPGSTLQAVGGTLGTGVSGTFLYLIAGLNVMILWGLVRAVRSGHYDDAAPGAGGPMSRVFGRFARTVSSPARMYPIGVLFGLGFDTASEVALLLLAAGAAGAGLPITAIFCLPILFAAGMSLLDTIDGSFMNFAYGWAFSNPARKAFYNLTVTGLSVAVALAIGTVELGGLLAQKLGAHGSFWSWLEHIDIGSLGVMIVALFLGTWLLALSIWHFGRIEERFALATTVAGPATATAAAARDQASGV